MLEFNSVTAPTFEARLAKDLCLSWDGNKMLCFQHIIEDHVGNKTTTRTVLMTIGQVYSFISALGIYHTEQMKED